MLHIKAWEANTLRQAAEQARQEMAAERKTEVEPLRVRARQRLQRPAIQASAQVPLSPARVSWALAVFITTSSAFARRGAPPRGPSLRPSSRQSGPPRPAR